MASDGQDKRLADRLRDNEEAIWQVVETVIVPRMLRALAAWLGPGRHWQDLEGFARSAQRTALRQLHERVNPQLEELETLEQFENWLVMTARNKFVRALRKVATEAKHASELEHLARDREAEEGRSPLELLARQTADEVVQQLQTNLSDAERVVFNGKLAQKSQPEIAAELACSTRTITTMWQRIRARLLREAAEDLA